MTRFWFSLLALCGAAQANDFFEKHVRPVLAAKCYACHSGQVKMAGLDLKSAASFQAVGKERLLDALSYEGKYKMPPSGKLADAELSRIREWAEMGAPWPTEVATATAPKKVESAHWAFQPLRKQPGSIDGFLKQALAAKGLTMAPRADKRTLLRRVTFDLTGLPPTPEELASFEREGDWSRVVERLLASPHYGEKWGRHWLDVARYAESTGMDEDHGYPHAWRYRDYVVKAFNEDKPYDRFLKEQIAGDLLDGGQNAEAIVATGFLALGPKPLAQQDRVKMVYDVVDEQIDTTSRAVLGITLACARCHDHKFDPLLTRDYYGWAGILASTKNFRNNGRPGAVSYIYYAPLDRKAFASYQSHRWRMYARQIELEGALVEELKAHDAAAVERIREVVPRVRRFQQTGEHTLDVLELDRWLCALTGNDADAEALVKDYETGAKKWRDRLSGWRKRYAEEVALDRDLPARPMPSRNDGKFFYAAAFNGGPLEHRDTPKLAALRAEWQKLKETLPEEPPMASAVCEGRPVEQRIFARGDHLSPGEPAPKRMPLVLAGAEQADVKDGSGRLELAEFLASPKNPLTARVFVNRVWQWHFGEGLVRTPSNFGRMGEAPTHPELLDYLATRFIESGWSVKALHREILRTQAYQMSSHVSPQAKAADPANRLWSRFGKRRLTVEELRDAMLAVDGTLDRTLGGTVYDKTQKRPRGKPEENRRRTIYSPVSRGSVPTMLAAFDFGDATTTSEGRTRTTVAPQALFMMNSAFLSERALALSKRLQGTEREKVEQLYREVLLRPATADEVDQAASYVTGLTSRTGSAETAWQSLCRVMLASSEFLYLD